MLSPGDMMFTKGIVLWLIAVMSSLCVLKHTEGATQAVYMRLEALGKKSLDLDYSYEKGGRVRYRLFLPTPFDRSVKYPLIVWLHGYGDHGTDNLSQLVYLDETLFPGGDTQGCQYFVCAPQASNGFWLADLAKTKDDVDHSASGPHRDMLDVTIRIIDELQTQYPIDERRITAVGISAGGTACWSLLSRQLHRFATVIPLGDNGASGVPIDSMIHTPIWAFHAAADPSIPVGGVAETVNALKAAGGKVHLTLTEDDRHNCWTKAFAEHDLLYWILNQRLDDANAPPPGSYRFPVSMRLWWNENWPPLVFLFVVVLLLTACYRHLRRYSMSGSNKTLHANRANAIPLSHSSSNRDYIGVVPTEAMPVRDDFKIPDFSKSGNEQ